MATLDSVADAVAAYVNAQSYAFNFDAHKTYDPELQRENLETVDVSIVPFGIVTEKAGREGTSRVSYQVNLLVTRGVDAAVSMGELMDFAEAVDRSLWGIEMDGMSWQTSEVIAAYDADSLRKGGMLTHLVRLTYFGTCTRV